MPVFRRVYKAQPVRPDSPTSVEPPEVLKHAGPLISVRIQLPYETERLLAESAAYYPPPVYGVALVDTGSNFTTIDRSVAARLKLERVGVPRTIWGSDGVESVEPIYAVRITFPGTSLPGYQLQDASEQGLVASRPFIPSELPGEFVAILGRDFLRFFVLTYNGFAGEFTLEPRAQTVS